MEWIEVAREHLKSIFTKFSTELKGSIKEKTVNLIADELNKIPIPVVGSLLSKTVRRAFNQEDQSGPEINEVLQILNTMQQSNEDFSDGFKNFVRDFEYFGERIETIIEIAGSTYEKLTVPKFIVSEPKFEVRYPSFDNEILFCLMNIGGGAVKVPEIKLIVEDWEPMFKVDYSLPAAPLDILDLKVKLTTKQDSYPLLKLNNEPSRRFGPNSEGAEDVRIQMSSKDNTLYRIRIHIPYKNLDTGEEDVLLYPPSDKPPLEVPFWYAPGWNSDIKLETMLERGKVLSEIEQSFRKVTTILEETTPTRNYDEIEKLDQRIKDAGINIMIHEFPGLPEMLTSFSALILQMAQLEKRPEILEVLLKFTHQVLRHCPPDPRGIFSADSLCDIINRPDLSNDIQVFFTESKESKRKKLLKKILKKERMKNDFFLSR